MTASTAAAAASSADGGDGGELVIAGGDDAAGVPVGVGLGDRRAITGDDADRDGVAATARQSRPTAGLHVREPVS
jgi:hypothetical protein